MGIPSRDPPVTNRRLYLIPLLFLAGFACRGPIGLVVPAAVICAFYFWEGNLKRLLLTAIAALVLLAAGTAALWLEHFTK